MDLFSILTLIGGLALFLYGMNAMGDGLAKVSGGKLEKILENLTSNPIKAVLLGAGVTAVIQSSSATTVMVVGFVNSGIMKLSQAVGVIMGANIGTTITSWILSLTGIQSDNFIIQMFKPTSFSPVLAIIGVIFILFINDSKKKDIGTIFIGFAILMYGMDMMSSAVKPLAEVPEFTNLLLKFSNPLLGVIAGALLTAVIQSSSASVGILQALCLTGAVPFSAAIPIIMTEHRNLYYCNPFCNRSQEECKTQLLDFLSSIRQQHRQELLLSTVYLMLLQRSFSFLLQRDWRNLPVLQSGTKKRMLLFQQRTESL